MGAKVSTSPVVGRERELAMLDAALVLSERGEGRAVLLTGEAGIGKTRLALETAKRATKFLVLHGAAHAPEGDLAYAPLLQAIGPWLRGLDAPLRDRMVRGLPALGRLLPDVATPEPPLGDASLEKTRLLDAVTRLFERVAATKPVLFVLDDLQWADAATLELLHFLARTLRSMRMLLVLTARSPDAESSATLRAVRASLRRIDALQEIELARLDDESGRALIRALLDGEPPRALDEALRRRTHGVPLFMEAIVRALVERGALSRRDGRWSLSRGAADELPATVRDVALERLRRLDPASRAILDHIAVDGGETPDVLLVSVFGRAAVDAAKLDALVRTDGVVHEVTHPILAEVAVADLALPARRAIHVALVGALQRIRSADLDRLGRHVRGAGDAVDREVAIAVLIAAGRAAMERHANELATRHWSAALELSRSRGESDRLGEVLERLGECWLRVGETSAATTVLEEALAVRAKLSDASAVARIRLLLARAAWDRGLVEPARAHVTAGIAAAPKPSREGFSLLAMDVSFAERVGDVGELAAAIERLRAAATGPRAIAEAGLASVMLHLRRGAPLEAARAIAEALEGPLDDPRLALRVHDLASLVGQELAEHVAMQVHARESIRLATTLGVPPSEMRAHGMLAVAAFLHGDFGATSAHARAAQELAHRYEIPRGQVRTRLFSAVLALRRGDADRAHRELCDARAILSSVSFDHHVDSDLVLFESVVALARGTKIEDARVIAVLGGTNGWMLPLRLLTLAEVHVARGETDRALAVADRLAKLGDHPWLGGTSAFARAMASRAPSDAEEAVELLSRIGVRYEAARARLLRAEIGGEGAARFAEEACASFAALETPRELDRARQVARSLGVRLAPVRRPGAKGTPLSKRELEVARLFAEGRTAAEVGKTLFISPHTATTHLHRIYDRLGVRSRAALAKYMIEAGLS